MPLSVQTKDLPPIVQDLPLIVKKLEIFFNSPEENTTISIVLSEPISEILNLNFTKNSTTTLQDLVNELISRITLYLRNSFNVAITKNDASKLQSFNSMRAKMEYIKFIKQFYFKKYLASNSVSGRLTIL